MWLADEQLAIVIRWAKRTLEVSVASDTSVTLHCNVHL
jgi:hypothetical protein